MVSVSLSSTKPYNDMKLVQFYNIWYWW